MSRFKKGQEQAQFEAEIEALGPVATVHELPVNPLVWDHWANQVDYRKIDLSIYRDGDTQQGIIGRSELIHEMVPGIRLDLYGASLTTVTVKLGHITKFFRYLTKIERDIGRNIQKCGHITSADGEGFKQFLLKEPGKYLKAKNQCLNYIRSRIEDALNSDFTLGQTRSLKYLLWPVIENDKSPSLHRDVDPKALKFIYNYAIKPRFNESLKHQHYGQLALRTGTDPRTIGTIGTNGNTNGRRGSKRNSQWYCWRNLAVLFETRIRKYVFNGEDIDKSDVGRIAATRFAIKQRAKRLNDLWGLGLPVASQESLWRMFAPDVDDTMAAYTLVSYHTGWMDTARAINVVDKAFEESDDWYSVRTDQLSHGQDKRGTVAILALGDETIDDSDENSSSESVKITAVRPKTGRLHSAFSLKKSRYQPFMVIKAQIERTRFLRDLLRELRSELLKKPQTIENRVDIAMIERKLRSPWIYFNSKGKGHKAVGLLGVSQGVSMVFNSSLKQSAKILANEKKKYDLVQSIEPLQPGDIRDGYAAFVYDASGSNIFSVQQALNHRSISSTRHYLRQKRQIAELFKKYRAMAQALFHEIGQGLSVDPTIMKLAISEYGITDEDRIALESFRITNEFRSMYGMGCKDPINPPSHVAPNHIAGTICQVQRCILCSHAKFTLDTPEPLAVRYAELQQLGRMIPPERFLTSSLSVELKGIETIREALQDQRVAEDFDDAVKRHTESLQSGEALIFDAVQLGHIETEIVPTNKKDWSK